MEKIRLGSLISPDSWYTSEANDDAENFPDETDCADGE